MNKCAAPAGRDDAAATRGRTQSGFLFQCSAKKRERLRPATRPSSTPRKASLSGSENSSGIAGAQASSYTAASYSVGAAALRCGSESAGGARARLEESLEELLRPAAVGLVASHTSRSVARIRQGVTAPAEGLRAANPPRQAIARTGPGAARDRRRLTRRERDRDVRQVEVQPLRQTAIHAAIHCRNRVDSR